MKTLLLRPLIAFSEKRCINVSGVRRVKVLGGLGPLAGLVLALLAAACAPEPGPSVAPPSPAALAAASPTELGHRIAHGTEIFVAGERLNVDRLQRFYARHGFEPVWAAKQSQATALTDAVLRAGDHGLSPELFHSKVLLSSSVLAPLDRDLLLSDAFMAYADALARGALPVERRRDDEILTPGPVDVAAALDAAIDSSDPGAKIDALAPSTPTYQALQQALKDLRTGQTGGKPGVASARQQTIEVNLERERWLPRKLPADRVWVNVADQRLTMYRDGSPALSMKVIVGQTSRGNQSPEFQVPIDAIWFNPPWAIPPDIAQNEIMPVVAKDPTYLERHNITILPNGILQQKAGPYSALGSLMFDMNNKFDVYLHDTSGRDLFLRDDRHISHGCIRIEDPRHLAALVMQQPLDQIDKTIATGDTNRTKVPKPVPVFVVYETAFADSDGKLQFRPDPYGRDAEIWQSLAPWRPVVAGR
jgi:murein L,D-transpeptidase YcbB/YkuD